MGGPKSDAKVGYYSTDASSPQQRRSIHRLTKGVEATGGGSTGEKVYLDQAKGSVEH
jgi:hypothetical protein